MAILALLVAAGAAKADARDDLISALRDHDCVLTNDEGEAVLAALDREAVQAAARALVSEGDAHIVGESFRLLPPLCGDGAGPVGTAAEPASTAADLPTLTREALAKRPGCRMRLDDLARDLADEGAATEAIDAVFATLARSGTLDVANGMGILRGCAAGSASASSSVDLVAAIRAMGAVQARDAVALELPALGCRLPADAAAAGMVLTEAVLARMGGGPDAPRLARALLARRVAEVLDNPGPAYETDRATGELVFLQCAP